ncbi:MAG: PAS domain-containing protein, partial [Negativicutes bacterium]|nr:PAS domain-containing protein [Negativicutes bacterium]
MEQNDLFPNLKDNQVFDYFKVIIDSAPVMIWVSDSSGLCCHFNERWLNFRGRTLEEEKGNGWAEGVHPDDYDYCLETYFNAFNSRQEFEMQYRLKRWDGEY